MDSLNEDVMDAIIVRCDSASLTSLHQVSRAWRGRVIVFDEIQATRRKLITSLAEKLIATIGHCCEKFTCSVDFNHLAAELTTKQLHDANALIAPLTYATIKKLDNSWNGSVPQYALPDSEINAFYAQVLVASVDVLADRALPFRKRIERWQQVANIEKTNNPSSLVKAAAEVLAAKILHQQGCRATMLCRGH